MFKNPGRKLKGLAKVIFALLLLFYVAIAVAIMAGMPIGENGALAGTSAIIVGVVVIVVGFLAAWLSSIALYAVGAAVDDLQSIRKIQQELLNKKNSEQ